uniref:NADH-ubiquinone oxidoreductase chain 4 n=1 Tax=Brachyrhynchus hsiaoi TaxID=928820 RepID=A0A059P0N3_9HEMI|nr:NADH dehydrogenase subunit 4 [Brachyrhynchus hsiaoi]ADQ64014.1 NADH dehydrogenase subunit 4 [Brachyrhynchus hsiaoi]
MMKLIFPLLFLSLSLPCNWWILVSVFFMIIFMMIFYPVCGFGTFYSFGFALDMISYWLVMLTLWIVLLMFIASFSVSLTSSSCYFTGLLMVLNIILVLCFSTTNLFMFYIMFEGSIIPTLFLIFGWGYQPERGMAGIYFLFYTLFASLPMLVSIAWVKYSVFTLFFYLIRLDFNIYLYLGLLLAFLVKVPMAFLHYWLPSAHVEAPISGSMILAGVLLKLGCYGIYKVMFFINNNLTCNAYIICISAFGMVYAGVLCLYQIDMKSLVAYSSVFHMGMVIWGFLMFNYFGMLGSILIVIGHGLCSSGLFCLVNLCYERTCTRSIYINKGLITVAPVLSMFWFMFCANNMASPFSLNLFGEVLIIGGVASWGIPGLSLLAVSSFLSCGVSIYLYSITQHGYYSGHPFLPVNVREYLLLFVHWLPLNFMFMMLDSFYCI